MKRWLCACLAVFCLATLLTSCGKGEDTSSTGGGDESRTISEVPVLDVELENLLSTSRVSEIMGTEMGAPQVFEDGTWVRYSSEDFRTVVDVNMQDGSEELFNAYIEMYYADAVDDEESGEHAKWSAENKELVVLVKGYMMSVKLESPGAKDADLLEKARTLMKELVAALPA